MKYLLMIYANEAAFGNPTPADMKAMMDSYDAFGQALTKHGAALSGEALMPTSMATTVRVHSGARTVTDGPFAETKEQLGGYYLLECKNLDAAIEIAALCPGAKLGSVELRPVMDTSM